MRSSWNGHSPVQRVPDPAQVGLGADQLDHVDGVAQPVDRVAGEQRHRQNPCGSDRSSNARIAKRSVMPASQSTTRCSSEASGGQRRRRVLHVVVEQRAHHALDARLLALRLRAEVDVLEHELAQAKHRAADLLPLHDVAGLVGALAAGRRTSVSIRSDPVAPSSSISARGRSSKPSTPARIASSMSWLM